MGSRATRAARGQQGVPVPRRLAASGPYGAVLLALLAFFLIPLVAGSWSLPVGADVPYYVWSSRLAGEAGLSVTDFRPGLHAVLLMVSGGTGLSLLQVIGAVTVALAVSTGLAATALAERGLGRDAVRSAAIGIAAGAYTARLASGYLANLLFAALFLAAIALLVGRPRRGAILPAALIGAAGLAHGLFLAVGAAVLGGAAVLRLLSGRGDRAGAREDLARLGTAAAGGAAIAGVGFLIASLGRPLSTEERAHSRDGLLNRAGLGGLLVDAYRARWREAAAAFRLPVILPLAALGGAALRLARRGVDALFACLMVSWAGITVAGIALGLLTSTVPAGRVLNFALVLPVLGAVGAVALGRWIAARRPRLGLAVGAGLVLGLVAGPFVAWTEAHPFMSHPDLEAAGAAAGVTDDLPARTPLVFMVDHQGPHPGVELSRFANVMRMALPADRSDDAVFLVGGSEDYRMRRAGLTGEAEHDGISRDAFARGAPVLDEPHAAFLVRTFNQPGWDDDAGTAEVGPLVRVLSEPVMGAIPVGDRAPKLAGIHAALLVPLTLLLLGVFAIAGAGWVAAWGPGLNPVGWALSPAVGAGTFVLLGVAADGAGLRLGAWGGATVLVALVGSLAVRQIKGATRAGNGTDTAD